MDVTIQTVVGYFDKFWRLLQQPLMQISGAHISAASILGSILAVVATVVLAKHVGRGINRALQSQDVDAGVRDSLEKVSRYLVIVLGVLFSLDNLGISINSLAAFGAVVMVGIGFGLQNIAQNFISGIIILIERPIKVGDIIRVGESSGRVVDIRVRSSVIQTRDDVTIILPNSKIISEAVISDSYSGQTIRRHINVGVAYGSDVEKVKELLCGAALQHTKVLPEPPPTAIFSDFGESSLDFDLRFWCSDIWDMDQTSSDIRCLIDKAFREANVTIPFPQRDVNLKGAPKTAA